MIVAGEIIDVNTKRRELIFRMLDGSIIAIDIPKDYPIQTVEGGRLVSTVLKVFRAAQNLYRYELVELSAADEDATEVMRRMRIVARSKLPEKVTRRANSLRRDGLDVVQVEPLSVSIGKIQAEIDLPLGLIIGVSNSVFEEIADFYKQNYFDPNRATIDITYIEDLAFLTITLFDDVKQRALVYPCFFHRDFVDVLKRNPSLHTYFINEIAKKYMAVGIGRVEW